MPCGLNRGDERGTSCATNDSEAESGLNPCSTFDILCSQGAVPKW